MKKVTVTGELRKVLKSLKLGTGRFVFSDTRKPRNLAEGTKAAGVKFVGLEITEEQKNKIITEMEQLGFKFHYIRYNNNFMGYSRGYWSGTRFCFSK